MDVQRRWHQVHVSDVLHQKAGPFRQILFVPRGFLRYDKRKDRYVVTNDAKLKNNMLPER